MISLCRGWEFTENWSESFARFEGTAQGVSLPHNVRELPLHYASPEYYEMISGYRRKLDIPEAWAEKRIFLQLDGAAHVATVYVNGTEAARHSCGYTAFRVELTGLVKPGENTVAVKLDSRENAAIPPFGFMIDYLTYGGLYREAWLDVREKVYIEDVFVTTPTLDTAHVELTVNGTESARVRILDGEECLAEGEGTKLNIAVKSAKPWNTSSPKMYTCEATLDNGDILSTDFGFRTAEFKADGFYLNGEKTFLRGLNRHQSYPYIGYAAPERLQRQDARILKNELGCSAVRTSHYPQSRYFIDECDRLGLLVFTEIPGWQHIGDEAWKEQAVRNTREMVLQYRNHPSIVLWGVRINESMDDDEFYKKTNAAAHELDPSRCTSGVRFTEKSSLLEDVYAYNDFSHSGNNAGCKKKKSVTPDMNKALLISEHNGHMFPTKSYDPWPKRQEQALRHARVLDAAMADGEHAGCFGWCMFDYPTHKDFGSGDRVCYHGVMDAFRNPKLAAYTYASQSEERDVLMIGSRMDIGDYAGGDVGTPYIFTNADSVELFKNGRAVKTFYPNGWKGLKHGPIPIDDMIGNLLETEENYGRTRATIMRRCLNAAKKYGIHMPLADKLRMGWCMVRYGMTMDDAMVLYGKYIGNWGGEATVWRFEAKKNGKITAAAECCPGKKLRIEAIPDTQELAEEDTYDMASVRIRIVDELGAVASYAQLPVTLKLTGEAELVGPEYVTAEGGMCGCYIKTVGKTGTARLEISAAGLEKVSVEFVIRQETGTCLNI